MSYWLQEMKWPEVAEYLEHDDIALIPVGSVEQHGPHLPLMTDSAEAIAVVEGVMERARVVSTPPVWFGWSPHHMGYPGSLTVRPEILIGLVEDLAYSLIYHGFKKIVIVNGHRVANLPWMEIAATRIRNRTGAYIAVTDVAMIAVQEIGAILEGELGSIGHGCESETSFMLHKYPDLVDMSKATKRLHEYDPKFVTSYTSMETRVMTRNPVSVRSTPEEARRQNGDYGHRGDPTLATADKGRRIYEAIVNNMVEFIERFVRPAQVKVCRPEVPV